MRIVNETAGVDIKYLPKVSWFADAGFLTATPFNFYKHFGFSAGISLNVPIYDGNQKEKEKQKLKLAENTRYSYQNHFTANYYQQLQQLNTELESLKSLTTEIKNQLSTAGRLVEALRLQLEAGTVQMLEYITAIKS